jgi:hypothetical protein
MNDIVLTLKSGTGGTVKVGWTVGGTEIMELTDISGMTVNIPEDFECISIPTSSTVYITLTGSGATYDVNATMLRYKVTAP